MILLLLPVTLTAVAEGYLTHQMHDGSVLRFERHKAIKHIGGLPFEPWNPMKTYRVPVILVAFSDCDFSNDDPKLFFHRLFNEQGFNLGMGPGSVADYFRDQSLGAFNVHFEIFGPVKVSSKQKSTGGSSYGSTPFLKAVEAIDAEVDFSVFDCFGTGSVPTAIFIYAGYGGNETADKCKGCIQPNTGNFRKEVNDGVTIDYYSASAELWSNDVSCGIGTICHEYCHTFGLPDLYPTSGSEYAVLDEWNLMDGGCFAGDGWCPPNLSIQERELLNWQTPVDLTKTTVITDMPPFDHQGVAYRIVNEGWSSEYYLLENRQQIGWDLMIPGHGLLVSHVDYDDDVWNSNAVNTSPKHHRFDYFHADGLDFNSYGSKNTYTAEGRSIRLQHTAYPYTDADGVVHDELTDTTMPAASLFHPRSDGSYLMGKSITQIREKDGLISFYFSDTPDAITAIQTNDIPVAIYDLQGHSYHSVQSLPKGIYLVRYADGTIRKIRR